MFDEALLDDPARVADADSEAVLRGAAMAGAQVRAGAEQADELNLGGALEAVRPRALILITRSGVGRAVARMISALLAPTCQVPIVLADTVPSWAGPLDVVWAHNDDPGDEPLAASLNRTAQYGATIVVSAPSEGPVAAAIGGKGTLMAPRIDAPSCRDFPHALASVLQTVISLGLLELDVEDLAGELDAEAARNHLGHESFVNPAKTLALRLADRTPLLWGLDPVATATAEYAAHALANDASVVCDVTEYRHALARVGLFHAAASSASGNAVFADPYETDAPASLVRVVLLAIRSGQAETAVRHSAERALGSADVIDAGEEILGEGLAGDGSAGEEPVGQETVKAAALALRFEMAAAYLGLATGTIGGAGRFT